jgi:hypothetical protein
MQDLIKESAGLIRFLPRRTYENYLIDPEAITAVLNRTATFRDGPPIEQAAVNAWLAANAENPRFFAAGAIMRTDPCWETEVNAPKLLRELSKAREGYRKIEHSMQITAWLLEHRPTALEEVAAYLRQILKTQPDQNG